VKNKISYIILSMPLRDGFSSGVDWNKVIKILYVFRIKWSEVHKCQALMQTLLTLNKSVTYWLPWLLEPYLLSGQRETIEFYRFSFWCYFLFTWLGSRVCPTLQKHSEHVFSMRGQEVGQVLILHLHVFVLYKQCRISSIYILILPWLFLAHLVAIQLWSGKWPFEWYTI
jgi:hypothetical protein